MPEAFNLLKRTLAQVLSCEFCEILKIPFLQDTSGRLLLYSIMEYWGYYSAIERPREKVELKG